MHNIWTEIVLREYPKTFKWEGLKWNIGLIKIRKFCIILVHPIGMDGGYFVYLVIDSKIQKYFSKKLFDAVRIESTKFFKFI